MRDLLDAAAEALLVVDEDLRVAEANARAAALLEREDLAGADATGLFPESVVARFPDLLEDPEVSGAVVEEEYFPAQERWFDVRLTSLADGVAVSLYDVTEWARRERELAERQDELALLNRLNDLVQELVADLVGAASRQEIEETVASALAATDVFDLAWVVDRPPGETGLSARTVAGDHGSLVEHLTEAGADSPEATAIEHREVRVVRELADSEAVPEAVRREAFAHGLQAAAAVPLEYGDTVFGAFGVYTARPGALAASGRTGLETLGKVAGFAINATRNRQALRSATRRELEFRLSAAAGPLPRIAAETGATLHVEGTAQPAPDRLLTYVAVDAGDPAAVRDAAEAAPEADRVRLVSEGEDRALLELGLTDSPLLALVEQGASIQETSLADGEGRVRVHLSPAPEVRSVVEDVVADTEGMELVASRTTEVAEDSAADLQRVLADDLTERQRTVLQTAYSGGYFESPRESTAEELAESIGISSPTLHHHLRAAHRKLLAPLLEDA